MLWLAFVRGSGLTKTTTSQRNKSNEESAQQNVERVPAAERGGTVEGGDVAHIMVERDHEHGMTGSIAQT